MTTITFKDVCKRYGQTQALQNVSFTVERGECVALLGPNGAGKTTALEILLGLRTANSGIAQIDGSVACTPQSSGFPDALRVGELIGFAAAHYARASSVESVLEAFDLSSYQNARVGGLSGGEQRRVALALAFAGNTDVVVLDEPSTGLDAESRRRLWSQIQTGIANRTTLFTTHYLEEAEALATRIVLIDRGNVRFDGTPDEFRSRFGAKRVEYVDGSGSKRVVASGDTDAYVRNLVHSGEPFSQLTVTQSSFEDIFLSLTGAAS
ncbi:MAG TPA: ABC transporter ATP-binding protein [Candidatus Aquilonibacter sp.]|nr:ABC transporter ATP-binding protein [Candidatus Aquilonibacter sp.]